MPDLKSGESVEIKGSAKLPYVIKRVGAAYSCSCPAWRNQSIPTNVRTCKHIRKIRGDEAEKERIGSMPEIKAEKAKAKAPALLLANKWTDEIDPTGYWMSEKLDGVRAYWDGTKLYSRLGNEFYAPKWFTDGLPRDGKLDGELYIGRKMLQKTISIVASIGLDQEWRQITYRVFDVPDSKEPFEHRYQKLIDLVIDSANHVDVVEQTPCKGIDHMKNILVGIERVRGEGVMLRQPRSLYEGCRSSTLLKVKTFLDDEAIITGYVDGKGNRKGMVGSFWVTGLGKFEGKKFKVGTGQKHKLLKNPPPIGTKITFRYVASGLSDDGLPKPASFVGICVDK